jgi:hypothetical protein
MKKAKKMGRPPKPPGVLVAATVSQELGDALQKIADESWPRYNRRQVVAAACEEYVRSRMTKPEAVNQ